MSGNIHTIAEFQTVEIPIGTVSTPPSQPDEEPTSSWFIRMDTNGKCTWTAEIYQSPFQRYPPGYQYICHDTNYWKRYGASFDTADELLAWLRDIIKDSTISFTIMYAQKHHSSILEYLAREPLEQSDPLE